MLGLDYLTLSRTAPTLSGGESQRIRLAGQIGCGLVGVLYILDEPSIGLHPRDNDRLLATRGQQLRDVGNTVVVVEHDEDTMRHADHMIDFGPGPGVRGGYVVAEGNLADGREVEGERYGAIPCPVNGRLLCPKQRREGKWQASSRLSMPTITILKTWTVEFPLGKLICVTGVSGSGKEFTRWRHSGGNSPSRSQRWQWRTGIPCPDRGHRTPRQNDCH